MKNIWRIFTRDVCHATRNVIAIIVAMGLIIVPALYAWYNIAASWDPYGNTKSLKVAVANVDSGYKSDLIPVRVNIGETVVSSLRANHDLDWQFVDRDTAIDGVHSGEYYAALIIPKQFSADMMTLFSPEMKHAELEYYLNEKINPIAPHITDQGASTVATTIDQTFAKTLAQVALDLVSSLLKFAQSPQMSEYVSNATKHISSISSQLKSAASQADSYASLMGATGKIISSTDRLLGSTGSSASDAKKALKQGTAGVKSLDEALAGVSTSMSSSLSDAAGAYDTISKQVDAAFSDMGSQSSQITDKLTTLQRNIQSQADTFGTYAEALRSLADAAHLQAVKDALNNAAQQAQNTQNSLQKVADSIGDASKKITDGTASADDTRKSLKKQIAAAKQSITDMANTYDTTIKPQLDELGKSMSDVVKQSGSVIDGLAATATSMSGLSGDITGSLSDVQSSLGDAATTLNASAEKLDSLNKQLTAVVGGSGIPDLSQITSADPYSIATLLSAPVSVNRIALYPVANYGSAMTPFYTVLSIWVGAIILVAMMKVSVSDREKAKVLGLGETLPMGETMGVKDAVIAGRTARDARRAAQATPRVARQRATVRPAPVSGVFRAIRHLRRDGAAAGHAGMPGRHVLPRRAVRASAAVPDGRLAVRAGVLAADLHADRVVRRHRQGHRRGAAGHAGGRLGRYLPDRDVAAVLPDDLQVAVVPVRGRCDAFGDGGVVRQRILGVDGQAGAVHPAGAATRPGAAQAGDAVE